MTPVRLAYARPAITVAYRAVDGFELTRTFGTIAAARRFAHDRVGKHPEIGSRYAVSGDGVGRVTVQGATLADLFPAEGAP